MSHDNKREFDLIIFGATGFTGFYILRDLLLSLEDANNGKEYATLKWAIAGRNQTKMTDKLNQISSELNKDLSHVQKIRADVNDEQSLVEMAKRTRLLINCVGPYYFYGRPVVKACVECSTHHIDISGEPNYIEQMVLEFHGQARQKGLVIVSTCGWDSIPCDLGVHLAKQKFDGRLHSVESFVQTIPGSHGYRINFGTLQSAIYGYKNKSQLKHIRRRLYTEVFTKKLPRSRILLKRRTMPFTHSQINGFNVEFPGSDRSVVQRTQYYNYQHHNECPVQIQTYFTVGSFTNLVGLIIFALMFAIMTATNFGCRLLENYPEFFTAGAFSKEGPNREQIESTRFQTFIFGKGWSKQSFKDSKDDVETEPAQDPDKSITVKVSGPDPGYIATSSCIVQSGLTILYELDKIPRGVLTPASAFRDTNLLDRLKSRGVIFEVMNP